MTIQETLAQVRAKYGASPTTDECGAICNETAWRHRNDPEHWGVSGKTFGNHATLYDGTAIAADIIQNGVTKEAYDCLIAAGDGGPATPTWNPVGVITDPNRPWLPPIVPQGQPPDPPDPPDPPTGCPCKAEFAALAAQVAALSDQVGALTGLVATTAADTQDRLARVEAVARVGRPFRFRQFGMTVNGAVDPVP